MPTKDRGFEFYRVRQRKDRDKDRDGDTQSVSGSSVTTIKERKHRKSFTSHGSSAETSTQGSVACQENALDQLPSLPETDESEGASASTSPLMRTGSSAANPTNIISKSVIETPANLQPYLEDPEDTGSIIVAPNRVAESEEWIGPQVEIERPRDSPFDSLTPTPKAKEDPFRYIHHAPEMETPKKTPRISKSPTRDPESDEAKTSSSDSGSIYSWVTKDNRADQYYYPSQMSNPFLPPGSFPAIPAETTVTAEPSQPQPVMVGPPSSSPPLHQTTGIQSLRAVGEPRQEQRKEYSPPARIARIPFTPHSSPSSDMGIAPGMLIPVDPALATIPMHHTQSNPLPYPSVPARMDHPANIIFRVGNVLPDIAALMDMYHGACNTVHVRDQHISDVETQKAMESEKLNKRIDGLTRDIHAMIRHREAQETKLRDDIDQCESKYKRMQENFLRERRHKEDALKAHAALKEELETNNKKHQDAVEDMSKAFSQEKEHMIGVHTDGRQSLINQLAQTVQNAEETLASRERKHEAEKQTQESRWHKHLREVQDKNTKVQHELEAIIDAKEQVCEEQRHTDSRANDSWKEEHEAISRQLDKEEQSSKQAVEDQHRTLSAKHQRDMDGLQSIMDSTLAQQKSEADRKLQKHQQDKSAIQTRLDQALAFHESEIQSANETFRRERDEYRRMMEAASERQHVDFQSRVATLQKEKDALAKPREISQTRQLREARDTISQLQQENDDLLRSRGASQSRQASEARDLIAKLQKENEMLRADKARSWKPKADDIALSRSSTPAPKEEKLERSRSNRTSGIFGTATSSKAPSSRGDENYRSHHHRDRTC